MSTSSVTGLILAAGKGTRMKSGLPKCLHRVCGVPMVKLVADSMMAAGVEKVIIVIGHGGDQIVAELGENYLYAWQNEQLGTGHAVRCAMDELDDISGTILIACGDTPLIGVDYFRDFLEKHRTSGNVCTLSVAELDDATGYGRVDIQNGFANRIIEQKVATEAEKEIKFANAGMYCVDAVALRDALSKLVLNPIQKEYFLTDIIAGFANSDRSVNAFTSRDPGILMGVNDRVQLAEANRLLREKINLDHMLGGVTIVDPANTYIGPFVKVGQDTIIEPGTHLVGRVEIEGNCRIGPNVRLTDVTVGENTIIFFSTAERSIIGSDIKIGPFANIRPKSTLGDGVRIGNFVEINRSTLAVGVKASHLTYIGDAVIGMETNIGAGTITCNYDGFHKNQTIIGKNAFVGSNSTLIAPITLGDGSMTAAGSVISDDVPSDAAGFGRARQTNKEDWAAKWRKINEGKLND
jgi:bifunctional UDP-N-acetylglucosamine pyrophosphorylase / glucosamine-1-phosphate N-acetyltransferase